MTADDLRELLADSEAEEFLILALLALAGEPMGRQRILEHMMAAGATLPPEQWAVELGRLRERRLVVDAGERGVAIAPDAAWAVLDRALDNGMFARASAAYVQATPVRRDWQGHIMLRSYRQGLALLRIALLTGEDSEAVAPVLDACLRCHEANYLHPLVEVCARPVFHPEIVARIHRGVRDGVLAVLVTHCQREPLAARMACAA